MTLTGVCYCGLEDIMQSDSDWCVCYCGLEDIMLTKPPAFMLKGLYLYDVRGGKRKRALNGENT